MIAPDEETRSSTIECTREGEWRRKAARNERKEEDEPAATRAVPRALTSAET